MNIFDELQQARYDDWGTHPPQFEWHNHERTAIESSFLQRVLKFAPEQQLLDIFCSWGRHVCFLGAQGYNVTGIDLSWPMLGYAHQQAMVSGLKTRFIQADIKNLPFNDGIDFAYSIQSSPFEAWNDEPTILAMLDSVRQVLTKAGQYVFGWNHDSILAVNVEPYLRQRLLEAGITTYDGQPLPIYHYGYVEQQLLIEKVGLRIASLYNNYQDTQPYDSTKPGMIVLVEKSSR